MVVGHVAPEAFVGGTIALVHEGDSITIDAEQRLLQLNVPEEELARRRAELETTAATLYAGRARKICETGFDCQPGSGNRLIATHLGAQNHAQPSCQRNQSLSASARG